MSGVIVSVGDFAIDTWNHPRFQGGLQAFAGLAEASAGGLATLGSGGLAAPIGWPVLAHGLDQMVAGLGTLVTGEYSSTLTEQLVAGRVQFYDSINNISVVTENGEVVTILYGRIN